MLRLSHLSLIVSLGCLSLSSAQEKKPDPAEEARIAQSQADAAVLRSVALPLDSAGLVEFFQKRTLREGDKVRIQKLVRQLGDEDFEAREAASRELIALGPLAKPMLRDALKDRDIEIVRRVETCLALADKTGTTDVLGAAVRQLARKPAANATATLLDFAPFVDDESVVDEIALAVAMTAVHGDKADDVLVKALDDRTAVRRAVAVEAAGRASGGNDELRKLVRKLLTDDDVQIRRRAATGLLAAKDREAVPVFINLLADLPPKQTWRIEEALIDLAGDKAPRVSGSDDAARKQQRDEWLRWWKENGDKVDLAKLGAARPYLGLTLISQRDLKGGLIGRVYEIDATGKVRWQIDNLRYPIDAQMLPNGNVLVGEYSTRQVTERTTDNKIVWTKAVNGIFVSCKRLPNGNTFIAMRNHIIEVDKEGKEVRTLTRNTNDIAGAQRLSNGGTAVLTSTGMFVLYDAADKEVRTFNTGGPAYLMGTTFEMLPGGRVLIPLYAQNKVVEFDVEGRKVWECNAQQPNTVQRLPNGHTLISSRLNANNPIVEVDRTGQVVWNHTATDATMVKATRR
jgi:HEAT repeat protein